MALAIMIADRPTPPQPCTATHSPGCHAALVDDGAKRGDEAAAEAGRGGEIQLFRQPHEVGVGKVERDIFGERAPGGEARLELVLADLMVAGIAFEAMAAAADERHRDAVAVLPARHLAADRQQPCRPVRGPAHAAARCRGRAPSSHASRCGKAPSPRP